eukprot:TRINITY_DN58052_c0_g1_i1.p1 TRINITY_DN58052_c0_g1~~TRINITY_DN58052_c0_g1_i1.p1  ORF type:complete len:338 (-),score=70.57 TRINITY_DN58052_c0_g1_i1:150-1163(-)
MAAEPHFSAMGGKKASSQASTSAGSESSGKSSSQKDRLPQQQKQEKTHRACLHKQLQKTKFCSYFLKGMCHYGTECAFAHTCAELQATPDLRKTRTCKAYAEGKCTDESCLFAHGEHELVSTGLFHKISLCKWHEKGRCRHGSECRFAHGAAELRDQKAAAGPAAAKPARDAKKTWMASEPQPMKVPQASEVQPSLGPAAAALAAAASLGLPLMQSPPLMPPWSELPKLSRPFAFDAAQLQNAVQAPPWLLRHNSLNPMLEMEHLRLSIATLSAECAQMQQQLMPLALIVPPGLGGQAAFSAADVVSISKLASMSNFKRSQRPIATDMTAEDSNWHR